jgi:hypothetical protein
MILSFRDRNTERFFNVGTVPGGNRSGLSGICRAGAEETAISE